MGILDWFRRRKVLDVVCWLDDASRWKGVVRAIEADLAAGRHVLLVAHFKRALAVAGEHLARAGIPFAARLPWTKADTDRLRAGGTPAVVATLAATLPDVQVGDASPAAPAGAGAVSVQAVDLHVLAAANDRVLRFATSLGGGRARASVSLEDPVLAAFAKPWVRDLLIRLGMSQDVPIESPMVSKGVHRALAKLAKRVTGDVRCDSATDWLARNLGA